MAHCDYLVHYNNTLVLQETGVAALLLCLVTLLWLRFTPPVKTTEKHI